MSAGPVIGMMGTQPRTELTIHTASVPDLGRRDPPALTVDRKLQHRPLYVGPGHGLVASCWSRRTGTTG